MKFEAGLILAKAFYNELIEPILDRHFPQLDFGAALIGDGSEVLGYDTAISTDHDWGPRLQTFLSEADFAKLADPIVSTLESQLPESFRDWPVAFDDADRATANDKSNGCLGSPHHGVEIYTIQCFARKTLGVASQDELKIQDWLSIPQQKLLSITSGEVFCDDKTGTLSTLRDKFSYYPDDLWLHLISAQWSKIAQEQAFVGRAGHVSDEIGSTLIATRLIEASMQLCFLLERRYAPYAKWFGTAFARLDCASQIAPLIQEVLTACDWRVRQQKLCLIFEKVGALQLEHSLPGAIPPQITDYHERPYLVVNADEIVSSIRQNIKNREVSNLPLFGSIDQVSNNPNLLCNINLCRRFVKAITE